MSKFKRCFLPKQKRIELYLLDMDFHNQRRRIRSKVKQLGYKRKQRRTWVWEYEYFCIDLRDGDAPINGFRCA